MLHLVLGGAGTGKTEYIYEQLEQTVAQGKKCILLVPEQASFESEKQLYRRLGAQNSISVEALSFTRLCDFIFRECGGLAGVHLDDTAKLLLMSVVLGELSDTLTIYRKNAGSAAFAAVMCDTVAELQTAGADADQLRQAAKESTNETLIGKLTDLSIIYDAFQAAVSRGYDDPNDHLVRACRILEGTQFFEGYSLFIDGFMAFMGAEWKLLERIMGAGGDVTVALPCERLSQIETAGAFTAAVNTANRLVQLATRCGVRTAAPVVLDTPRRYEPKSLAFLAQEYPHIGGEPFVGEPAGVFLASCEDLYDEIETIAAQIASLVREGVRYREIAVISRGLERYLAPLRTVFARYNISYFTDLRMDIEAHPFIGAVTGALEAVRRGFVSEQMLALAQNAVCGLDSEQAGLLENYCYTWNVEGNGWTTAFVNNPDGMTEGFTDAQTRTLARINTARETLMGPLMDLQRQLKECSGQEFAAGIFAYLEQTEAPERLQALADEMPPAQGKVFLETSAQVWDALIGLLDVFGGALGGVRLPLGRLVDLFKLGVASVKLGVLPQTIDQVLVGTADRIRPTAPRVVFVIGLNEGEFPLWGGTSGLLSADERERLRTKGIDLLRTAEQQALFEKYYVYFALTQASQRLYISYPQRDTAGVGLAPSSVVAHVRELFNGAIPTFGESDGFARAHNDATAFDLMSRLWRTHSPEAGALKEYFSRRRPEGLGALERLAQGEQFELRTPEGQELFAGNMRLSPSRIERYETCPFSYFCQSGLRLKVRRRVGFNPLESGSLIHFVLEQMLKEHGGLGIAAMEMQELQERVRGLIQAHLLARIPDFEGMPQRFKYLFERLVKTLARLLLQLGREFAQSEFIPVAFEQQIGKGCEVAPLILHTPGGTQIIVEGVVDRVDELVRGGKRYIRVVDYKSGQKEFRLSDVCQGLNLQMLIYLFALCDSSAPDGMQNMPAGVLYMPARDKVIAAGRDTTDAKVHKEQVKLWKMNGILLDDIVSLTSMERELEGVFIPVKCNKDGAIDSARSSIASLAQMGQIRRSIERQIIEMSTALQAGGIAACPVTSVADALPCDWCDYRAVCGHEEQDEVRPYLKLDKDAAMREIEEANANG